jgi:hypothetical protein
MQDGKHISSAFNGPIYVVQLDYVVDVLDFA